MQHHEMLWLWFTDTDIANLSPCDWAAIDSFVFAGRRVYLLCLVSDQHEWKSIYAKVQHWAHLKI